jgi:hypothetical protein
MLAAAILLFTKGLTNPISNKVPIQETWNSTILFLNMENYEIDWICIPPNTLFYSNETSILYTHSPTSHSLVKTKNS